MSLSTPTPQPRILVDPATPLLDTPLHIRLAAFPLEAPSRCAWRCVI